MDQTAGSVSHIDTCGMVLIHRVIRREIGALPRLIDGAREGPRVKRVARHAQEMLTFLDIHHRGEDELLWPVLRAKVPSALELAARMESDHHQVVAVVDRVRAQLPGWSMHPDRTSGARMAEQLTAVLPVLTTHLDAEESEVLPLVAAHFNPAEWGALGQHGFAAIPPKRRPITLAHILEEADVDEQRRFSHHVPAPAMLAYRLIGRRQHARETAALRT